MTSAYFSTCFFYGMKNSFGCGCNAIYITFFIIHVHYIEVRNIKLYAGTFQSFSICFHLEISLTKTLEQLSWLILNYIQVGREGEEGRFLNRAPRFQNIETHIRSITCTFKGINKQLRFKGRSLIGHKRKIGLFKLFRHAYLEWQFEILILLLNKKGWNWPRVSFLTALVF